MLSYKRIILVGLGLFCMGSFAGDVAEKSFTEISRGYVPEIGSVRENLHAISEGKDNFADFIEVNAKGLHEMAEKFREIKNGHADQIARGEYKEYLDHLGAFLAGLKEVYPNPVDLTLTRVNMLRAFVDNDRFRVDKKSDLKGDGVKNAK